MNSIYFSFGIHNHQPVGNFEFVFEDVYQKSYEPFLAILESHPHIKLGMHYSGILLEWLVEKKPDYIKRLKKMVASGQIEMITGGYYEPILPIISPEDRIGQIRKLTRYIEEKIKDEPVGMWCAERVWEPHLVHSIRQAGVEYTILDDAHFKYAGVDEKDMYGYFVSEELGKTINLFPISEKLRYTIPFQEPEVTIATLRGIASEKSDQLIVFADDGEKFGSWPGTYDHVYTNGWLDRFFTALENNRDWIKLTHFRNIPKKLEPKGRIYLPTASYSEMMHWALRVDGFHAYEKFEEKLKDLDLWDTYKTYVRGGFWRNFLSKYHESNNMQKKMLWVSNKVWQAESKIPKEVFDAARDQLWAGQCNCPYWHGVFGGLYLPHLRHANYNALITAGKMVDDAVKGDKPWVECRELDFDADGRPEVMLESNQLNLYFSTIGGRLFEIDVRDRGVNALNLMSRRTEGYHQKLLEMNQTQTSLPEEGVASIHDRTVAKEEGLDAYLVQDWYPRGSLIDHFLTENETLDAFAKCQYSEQGDFVNQPYQSKWTQKGNQVVLTLERLGHVWVGNKHLPVEVQKEVTLLPGQSEYTVKYTVVNKSDQPVDVRFGVENAFAFTAGDAPERHYSVPNVTLSDNALRSKGQLESVSTLSLIDEYADFKATVSFEKPTDVWRFPIETVSMSEGGFERVFQGAVLLSFWRLSLQKLASWRIQLRFQFDKSV